MSTEILVDEWCVLVGVLGRAFLPCDEDGQSAHAERAADLIKYDDWPQ